MPYLSPRVRAPAPASFPLGASCRGLGPSSWTPTFCPGSQAVGPTRGAGGRDGLRSPLARCAPAACSPSARARRLSYRAVTPSGGGEQPALTLPLPRPPSSPPPYPCRLRGAAEGGAGGPGLSPGPPPGAHRGTQDRCPNRALQLSSLETGLSWAGGRAMIGEGGSRDPPARARLRTAWGWGESESRAQEGTKMKPTGHPQWGRTRALDSCSVSPPPCGPPRVL